MKTWEFKNYEKTKLKDDKNNLKRWFYLCENNHHYKELFAFLYGLHVEELLDNEVEYLLEDIETFGLHAFIDQYYKYRHLGFFCKIVLAS